MTMTRKEILDSIVVDGTGIEVTQNEALKAMSVHAKQTAIAFAKWFPKYKKELLRKEKDKAKWIEIVNTPIEEFYNLFLKDQEKQ